MAAARVNLYPLLMRYHRDTRHPHSPLGHRRARNHLALAERRQAGSMKLLMGLLAAMLLLAGVGTSHAVVRIANDRGGQIGRYVYRYDQLRASGQTIMIDGLCASSCTIVLGAIPHEKICVTRNANLAFHAAWDFGARGQAITNPGATRMLYLMYPSQVRHWIANRGGLSPRMIFLRGRQLEAMYRPCYLDAQVAAPR